MSCAAFTVLSVLATFRKKGNKFFVVGTAVLAVVFLFIASFLAWRDKATQLAALQEKLSTPDLQFQFGNTFWGDRDGYLMFLVNGVVTNQHGPDSGAMNWQMKLELPYPSNSQIQGTIIPSPKGELAPKGAEVTFSPSEYWPTKTLEPIRSGAGVPGWIWCVFPLPSGDFKKFGSSALIVSFDDIVSGKTHYARQPINDTSKGMYLPWNPPAIHPKHP